MHLKKQKLNIKGLNLTWRETLSREVLYTSGSKKFLLKTPRKPYPIKYIPPTKKPNYSSTYLLNTRIDESGINIPLLHPIQPRPLENLGISTPDKLLQLLIIKKSTLQILLRKIPRLKS